MHTFKHTNVTNEQQEMSADNASALYFVNWFRTLDTSDAKKLYTLARMTFGPNPYLARREPGSVNHMTSQLLAGDDTVNIIKNCLTRDGKWTQRGKERFSKFMVYRICGLGFLRARGATPPFKATPKIIPIKAAMDYIDDYDNGYCPDRLERLEQMCDYAVAEPGQCGDKTDYGRYRGIRRLTPMYGHMENFLQLVEWRMRESKPLEAFGLSDENNDYFSPTELDDITSEFVAFLEENPPIPPIRPFAVVSLVEWFRQKFPRQASKVKDQLDRLVEDAESGRYELSNATVQCCPAKNNNNPSAASAASAAAEFPVASRWRYGPCTLLCASHGADDDPATEEKERPEGTDSK